MTLGNVVVSTCGPGVPLLPNGVRLGAGPLRAIDPRIAPARVRAPAAASDELREGASIAASARGRTGLDDLLAGLAGRDARALRRAAWALTGYGPGLTPEGDDILCGAALALVIAGPESARSVARARELAGALVLDDLELRTTPLSRTLVSLAALGAGPEPLKRLVAGQHSAREELRGLGASSGRALLGAFRAGAAVLNPRRPRRREPGRGPSGASRAVPLR